MNKLLISISLMLILVATMAAATLDTCQVMGNYIFVRGEMNETYTDYTINCVHGGITEIADGNSGWTGVVMEAPAYDTNICAMNDTIFLNYSISGEMQFGGSCVLGPYVPMSQPVNGVVPIPIECRGSNCVVVPEFSTVTLGIAIAGAMLGLVLLRKQN